MEIGDGGIDVIFSKGKGERRAGGRKMAGKGLGF